MSQSKEGREKSAKQTKRPGVSKAEEGSSGRDVARICPTERGEKNYDVGAVPWLQVCNPPTLKTGQPPIGEI